MHSFINDQYIPGMYVWSIDPNTYSSFSSSLLLFPSPPSYPIHAYIYNHLTPNHLFIQTYPPSSASTSYHQFPYYSPRTHHRLWDNTGHQWRLERDTCRRFCSLERIDRWIFRRRGIGTGWGGWGLAEGGRKNSLCARRRRRRRRRGENIHEQ